MGSYAIMISPIGGRLATSSKCSIGRKESIARAMLLPSSSSSSRVPVSCFHFRSGAGSPKAQSLQIRLEVGRVCKASSQSAGQLARRSNRSEHVCRGLAIGGDGIIHGGSDGGAGGGGGEGGGGGGGGGEEAAEGDGGKGKGGFLAVLANGWKERVDADPQFGFKVLTEQVIGVTASVIGDMASRPNFGLTQLDFVFSTLVVGSILNFSLMFLLAPVASQTSVSLPGIFASCPAGHMFESGGFSVVERAGTLLYKGLQFSAVGFAAGLTGTAITNTLVAARKKLSPGSVSESGSPPPPTLLNAATWALQLGVSSNLRYQSLNGLELILGPALPPSVFRSLVFVLRGLNNMVGGASFVTLARITGSQK